MVKKLFIRTFGCQMNEYDSDKMADVLAASEDIVKTDTPEDAVIILEIGNEGAHFEAAFPQLPVFWLETSAGEDQVLLVTRQALAAQTRLTAQ